jgi:O-acetyl-ADP-ribose deacetylase (regulator of RNase III)
MANIEYRKGNLLDVQYGVIAHGVNCQGVMGSGVALAVRQKYPQAYEDYRNFCASNILGGSASLLGEVQCSTEKNIVVANCFTQNFYGTGKRQVNYEAVAKCFESLNQQTDRVNIPKIGAGLGGGDWKVIEAIINSEFKGDVVVWEL